MRPLRVVVAGTGFVSQFWLPVLAARPDVELVGVAEPDEARATAATAAHGLACPRFTDLARALDGLEPDLLVNLTPPAAHAEVVGLALDRGCHVFGEKPMAASFEEAVVLVAQAERLGRTFAVMQNRRYAPGIRRLRAGIEAGEIGEPTFLSADMFMAPRHTNTYLHASQSPLLREMAVHTFDQARYLAGADAVAVTAHELDPPGSWYRGPAIAACTFELSNGALFSYRGSWVSDGFSTSYDSVWRVSGTRGTAIWDGEGAPLAELALPRPEDAKAAPVERRPWPLADRRSGYEACIDAVLGAVAAGRRPETDCTDNLRSLAMVFAALGAAREGRRVELSELL